jgi:hypothetical protein
LTMGVMRRRWKKEVASTAGASVGMEEEITRFWLSPEWWASM